MLVTSSGDVGLGAICVCPSIIESARDPIIFSSFFRLEIALDSGTSTKEAERRIAAIPEEKRYLTRVLDSLDSAFADFDTETAMLDLPHMQNRKPEAIKRYLEFRLRQFKMLLDAVEDYVGEKYPATGGHS